MKPHRPWWLMRRSHDKFNRWLGSGPTRMLLWMLGRLMSGYYELKQENRRLRKQLEERNQV